MECLKDYIGLKWKNAPVPDSGVYINQLAGISLKSIDNLANAEQIDFLGVWDDIQTRSLKRLQTHVINYFAKRYQLKPINESLALPTYYIDGAQNTPASVSYRGFTFDLGWQPSPLAAIHIETLRLYVNADISGLEIKVFEMFDSQIGNVIDTITVDAVAGWNDIKVQKDYPYQKILVGYDATSIDSVWMPLNNLLNAAQWWWTYGWGYGYPQSPYQAILRGGNYTVGQPTVNQINNLYGLSGNISVVCSYDNLLCANKKVFTNVLWYLLGVELMLERIFSDRLNRYTTIDAKKAKEQHDYYESVFREEMQATFDGIELTTWDGCLICSAPVRLEHSLP